MLLDPVLPIGRRVLVAGAPMLGEDLPGFAQFILEDLEDIAGVLLAPGVGRGKFPVSSRSTPHPLDADSDAKDRHDNHHRAEPEPPSRPGEGHGTTPSRDAHRLRLIIAGTRRALSG